MALCSRTEGGRITLDSSQVCAATMQLFQHCFWAYKRSRRLRSRLGTGPLRILGFCVLLLGAREVCTSGAPPFLFAALPQSIMKIMDDVDRQRFGFMSRDWKMLRIHASSGKPACPTRSKRAERKNAFVYASHADPALDSLQGWKFDAAPLNLKSAINHKSTDCAAWLDHHLLLEPCTICDGLRGYRGLGILVLRKWRDLALEPLEVQLLQAFADQGGLLS